MKKQDLFEMAVTLAAALIPHHTEARTFSMQAPMMSGSIRAKMIMEEYKMLEGVAKELGIIETATGEPEQPKEGEQPKPPDIHGLQQPCVECQKPFEDQVKYTGRYAWKDKKPICKGCFDKLKEASKPK